MGVNHQVHLEARARRLFQAWGIEIKIELVVRSILVLSAVIA
jgi:hypothetical protein